MLYRNKYPVFCTPFLCNKLQKNPMYSPFSFLRNITIVSKIFVLWSPFIGSGNPKDPRYQSRIIVPIGSKNTLTIRGDENASNIKGLFALLHQRKHFNPQCNDCQPKAHLSSTDSCRFNGNKLSCLRYSLSIISKQQVNRSLRGGIFGKCYER